MDANKVNPKAILLISPAQAALVVTSLDEANKFVLYSEMLKIVMQREPTQADCDVLDAMMSVMQQARLRLALFRIVLSPEIFGLIRNEQSIVKLHGALAKHIVTGVFGVPMGEAGIGVMPRDGNTPEDAEDLHKMRTEANYLESFYEDLVAKAHAAGTIVIACDA